jgi:cellobiose epimerase
MRLFRSSQPDIRQITEILEKILLQNILPFWYPKTIDYQDGGYQLNHDLLGNYQGRNRKYLVSQARHVWFFSRLSTSPYGTIDHLKAAQHGYEFLRDRLWDQQYGGFYWAVDASGKTPTKPEKHLYGQAFALYALSEYAIASKDEAPIQLANTLFNCLEKHAYDSANGGYQECFQPDWQPITSEQIGYLGVSGRFKLTNIHLHLMEAIEVYHRVNGSSRVRERLLELILINSSTVVRKPIGTCTDQHYSDWTPVDSPEAKRVFYGHTLESICLLSMACRTAGLSNSLLLDLYRSFFSYALRYGYDRRRGGFYDSGRYNKFADQRTKIWWVQAESLVAALRMYEFTKEDIYLQCFCQTLDWIVKYQVDWHRGDWYPEILPNGQPTGSKAGAWKCSYHNGRSILECLELLKISALHKCGMN